MKKIKKVLKNIILNHPSIKGYNPWRIIMVHSVVVIFSAFMIFSLLIMLKTSWGLWHNRILAKLALIFSGIIPPVWFWVEYCLIWWRAPKDKRPKFEEFKYGHDLGRNLWLAFFAVILALYFKDSLTHFTDINP